MIPRFFVNPASIRESTAILVESGIPYQIQKVLRMKKGETVILLDNTGMEYHSRLREISKKEIVADIFEKKLNENQPIQKIILFQALPKKMALFELIVQKCTEIGVSEFVPVITTRTERFSVPNFVRLQTIAKEAAEQSGGGVIPKIREPVPFQNAVEAKNGILFDHSGLSWFKVKNALAVNEPVSLYIGPEGGFTGKETAMAKEQGHLIINLGNRTLRMETAAIVASAYIGARKYLT